MSYITATIADKDGLLATAEAHFAHRAAFWSKDFTALGHVPDFLVNQDESTVAQLAKLDVKERFNRDDAIITAVKLILRGRK